jgi:hypothetical protein
MHLRHFVAAYEDAGDLALVIADRLINEVDVFDIVLSLFWDIV